MHIGQAFTKDQKIYLTEVKRIKDDLDDEAEISFLECNGVFWERWKTYGIHPAVILVDGDKRAFCKKYDLNLGEEFMNDESLHFVRVFHYSKSKSKYYRFNFDGNVELSMQLDIDFDENELEYFESRYCDEVCLWLYQSDIFFLPNTLKDEDMQELLSIPLPEEDSDYYINKGNPMDWFNLLQLFPHLLKF